MAFDFGTAFGAYANMGRQLDRDAEQKDQWEKSFGLQKAADQRAQDLHGYQLAGMQRAQKQQQAADAILDAARQMDALHTQIAQLGDNDAIPEALLKQATGFYNDHPVMQNGMRASIQTVGGKPMLVHGTPGRMDSQVLPINKAALAAGLSTGHELLMQQLGMTSPEAYQTWYKQMKDNGFRDREVGAKEEANRIAGLEVEAKSPYFAAYANYLNRRGGEGGGAGHGLTGKMATLEVPTGDTANGKPVMAKVKVYHDGKGWKNIVDDSPVNTKGARMVEDGPSGGTARVDMKPAEFFATFPPKPGETEEASMRRYLKFISGGSVGGGGVQAVTSMAGGGNTDGQGTTRGGNGDSQWMPSPPAVSRLSVDDGYGDTYTYDPDQRSLPQRGLDLRDRIRATTTDWQADKLRRQGLMKDPRTGKIVPIPKMDW